MLIVLLSFQVRDVFDESPFLIPDDSVSIMNGTNEGNVWACLPMSQSNRNLTHSSITVSQLPVYTEETDLNTPSRTPFCFSLQLHIIGICLL